MLIRAEGASVAEVSRTTCLRCLCETAGCCVAAGQALTPEAKFKLKLRPGDVGCVMAVSQSEPREG